MYRTEILPDGHPSGADTIEHFNLSSIYYKNNKKHREDGPAVVSKKVNGGVAYEKYYINGELHREDGPAVIFYNDHSGYQYRSNSTHIPGALYYIKGYQLKRADFLKRKKVFELKEFEIKNINFGGKQWNLKKP